MREALRREALMREAGALAYSVKLSAIASKPSAAFTGVTN